MTSLPFDRDAIRALIREAGEPLSDAVLPIRRLWAARRHTLTSGEATRPAGALEPGSTRAAGFHTDHALAAARVWLHSFGSTTAECVLQLVDVADGSVLAEERLHPVIDQVWYELRPPEPVPGGFEVRVLAVSGTVAPAVTSEHVAWQADVLEFIPFQVRASPGMLTADVADPHAVLGLELPWQRDGYSVSPADGVAFDTIVGSGGRYVPAEQLKRIAVWPFEIDGRDVSLLSGDQGFTLRGEQGLVLSGSMSASSMTITIQADGPVEFVASAPREDLLAAMPRFGASDSAVAGRLTRFYRERALSWPFRDYTASAVGWKHWLTRMLSWTDTEGRAAQAADIADTRQDDEGWLWTRTDCAGWPFPDPTRYDTRHPSASLSFVSAVVSHYAWTGDEQFLSQQLPRARRAMAWIEERFGVQEHGLLVNDSPDQDGQAGSLGTHYWDIVPGGATDAYANVLLYGAVVQLARLERHVGDAARADDLRDLASRVRDEFRRVFWDEAAGRFIQNVDATGRRHDYGSSYLNLEALAIGLGTNADAARILDWLDSGPTELTERVLLDAPSGAGLSVENGAEVRRDFVVESEFAAVAAMILASAVTSPFTLRLATDTGTVVAERRVERWWDRGWAALDVEPQPPGAYVLTVAAEGPGLSWQRTAEDTLSLAVVSPHRPGPADIYSAWGFAPRASTRRNDFWYTFGWSGVETDYGEQVQDGGTALYIAGFDIEARARLSPDLAWRRLTAILQRAELPDRLCGGAPLSRGEHPQAMLPGQVGVDVPFPESGLAPSAALPAFFGFDPRPDGLRIYPALPTELDYLEIDRLRWRDHVLRVRVERDRIRVFALHHELTASLSPESAVVLRPTGDGQLVLHPESIREEQR